MEEQKLHFAFKTGTDPHLIGQLLAYLVEKQAKYEFFLSGIYIARKDIKLLMAVKLRFGECLELQPEFKGLDHGSLNTLSRAQSE